MLIFTACEKLVIFNVNSLSYKIKFLNSKPGIKLIKIH